MTADKETLGLDGILLVHNHFLTLEQMHACLPWLRYQPCAFKGLSAFCYL